MRAMSRRAAAFQITDPQLTAAALLDSLSSCVVLRLVDHGRQSLHYLDTATDDLYRTGGVLIAKPQSQGWSLIREQAGSGRPVASCRTASPPQCATDLPAGPLREQLLDSVADQSLRETAYVQIDRQALTQAGFGTRLVLESASVAGELLARRLLLPRQVAMDAVETGLLQALTAMQGLLALQDRSWYPLLRPALSERP